MTTVTKQCERDGCTETVSYGVETRNVPKYCSFRCRDIAEYGWNKGGYTK